MSPSGKKLSDEGRRRLRTRCAKLFYEKGHSQREIADELHVHHSYVSRLIREAHEAGIVQIEIVMPFEERLPQDLIAEFNLRDAQVVASPSLGDDESSPLPASQLSEPLGKAAAEYLERVDSPLRDGMRIGLSCGSTLLEMIIAFNKRRFRDLSISPLTVEGLPEYTHEAPSTLVGLMRSKFPTGCKTFAPLVMPVLPASGKGKKGVQAKLENLAERAEELYGWQVDELERRTKNLQIAVIGVGTVDPSAKNRAFSQILRLCGVKKTDVRKHGIVGEIVNRPYDADGGDRTEALGLRNKGSLSIPLDILKKLAESKPVIALAGGQEKVEAIYVALQAGLANILITDSRTAQSLLDMAGKERTQKSRA